MTLDEWAEQLAGALGIAEVPPVGRVLDLARDAAHAVARPAAPVTTYLVGTAVGQGMSWDDALAITARLLARTDAGG